MKLHSRRRSMKSPPSRLAFSVRSKPTHRRRTGKKKRPKPKRVLPCASVLESYRCPWRTLSRVAWHESRLLLFRNRHHRKLYALPLALTHAQRLALPLIAPEKFGIVVSLSLHAFPSEHYVGAGRNAMQYEAPALIANRLAEMIRTCAQPRFRYSNDHGI